MVNTVWVINSYMLNIKVQVNYHNIAAATQNSLALGLNNGCRPRIFEQMALQSHQSKEQAAGADTWQSLGLDTVLLPTR